MKPSALFWGDNEKPIVSYMKTETPPLVILGSARKDSDTKKHVDRIFQELLHHQIDLLDFNIHNFCYDASYPDYDDFDRLTSVLLSHQTIVFATPVYWYSMSGIIKSFFDRFTDLVTVKKELGRKFKGKSISFIAVGTDPTLPLGFEVPFGLTADYFDMHFLGGLYLSSSEDGMPHTNNSEVIEFIAKVKVGAAMDKVLRK